MKLKKIINKVYEKIIHECMILKIKIVKIKEQEKKEIPVIVSLTTFPKRFESVKITLKSMLNQSVKPQKIIVWLGNDVIDLNINQIFKDEINKGIEFRIDEKNNIYSHKKYYYAMKEYSDLPIILIDDDLIYPSNMIESLWNNHLKFNDSIIARRVHKITWNDNDTIQRYNNWDGDTKVFNKKVTGYFFTTGAGTLLPPNLFNDNTLNLNNILNLAPYADDVWLNFMAVLNKIPIVLIKNGIPMPATVKGSQTTALAYSNLGNNQNDIYINDLIKHYSLKKSDIDWLS